MNGEKPPVTKTMNILMLHDDLLLACLAVVSRLYHPDSRFGCDETCLYVCLQFPQDISPVRWFTLCRRPSQITKPNPNPRFTSCFAPYRALMDRTMKKKDKKSHDNALVSIQTRKSPSLPLWGPWSLIAVGYNIYKIGGEDKNGLPSSRVFVMDCRSRTWHKAPSMRVARKCPRVRVFGGKIYVDSSKDIDSSDLIECFDPKTQMWEDVADPDEKLRGWLPDCACVIDNVLYGVNVMDFYGRGLLNKLVWYESEGRCWRAVKGLRKLPDLPAGYRSVRLVGYGGKIAVLWEKDVRIEDKKKIWWAAVLWETQILCAEISLERRNEHEIHGKVLWCDVVLTVPRSSTFLQVLAVTV
ncbi:unnamed protein product [Microthlaspi erraticum]|uniref:FKB95-like N-terminal Kelch domain-containing protein n=1 Tax=Microthlaspi erraticum TaxID=1685480 RepID=A0A6D2J7G1_9BRAS|nr:unnamed protein product [Microthlaspi erraticum]